MSKAFGIAFSAAIVVIAVVVWTGFEKTKGNHLIPTGSIGKVRTARVDDNTTFMVVDFNIRNDSDRQMVVRNIQAMFELRDGSFVEGSPIAARDVISAFHAYPLLGEQFNPVLKERDVIQPHESLDRMVGLRFDAPSDVVNNRKRVVLKIEDVTGPVLEMAK
jgi:hypothetical protein